MADESHSQSEVSRVTAEAEAGLAQMDSSPFSSSAFESLKKRVSQYVNDLVNESIKVSKRHKADTVSAAHVDRASEYLYVGTSRKIFRHLGTVGGILLGAALSNILAMTLAGQYTGGGTIASAVLGIIGAFLVALHVAKD